MRLHPFLLLSGLLLPGCVYQGYGYGGSYRPPLLAGAAEYVVPTPAPPPAPAPGPVSPHPLPAPGAAPTDEETSPDNPPAPPPPAPSAPAAAPTLPEAAHPAAGWGGAYQNPAPGPSNSAQP